MTCKTCACANSSKSSKNKRRNTSLAITFSVPKDQYRRQWKEIREWSGLSSVEVLEHHEVHDGAFTDQRATQSLHVRHLSSLPCSCETDPSPHPSAKASSSSDGANVDDCTIIVDVGKFFWQSALDICPGAGVRHMDAVLLTHAHFDAIGGFDDLRDWTKRVQNVRSPSSITISRLCWSSALWVYSQTCVWVTKSDEVLRHCVTSCSLSL